MPRFFQSKKNLKRHRMTLRNYVVHLHATLDFIMNVNGHLPFEEAFHIGYLSPDHERRITPIDASFLTNLEILPEIAENPEIARTQS